MSSLSASERAAAQRAIVVKENAAQQEVAAKVIEPERITWNTIKNGKSDFLLKYLEINDEFSNQATGIDSKTGAVIMKWVAITHPEILISEDHKCGISLSKVWYNRSYGPLSEVKLNGDWPLKKEEADKLTIQYEIGQGRLDDANYKNYLIDRLRRVLFYSLGSLSVGEVIGTVGDVYGYLDSDKLVCSQPKNKTGVVAVKKHKGSQKKLLNSGGPDAPCNMMPWEIMSEFLKKFGVDYKENDSSVTQCHKLNALINNLNSCEANVERSRTMLCYLGESGEGTTEQICQRLQRVKMQMIAQVSNAALKQEEEELNEKSGMDLYADNLNTGGVYLYK